MTAFAAALRARVRPDRAAELLRRLPSRGVGVALAAVLVLGGALLWLRDSSLVAVEQVEVSGLEGPQAGRIRAALEAAALEQSTLHADADALRAAVGAFPLVRDVRVSAHPPHRLAVTVVSARPVAVLAGRTGGRIAAAADGELLRAVGPTGGLPEVPVPTTPVAGPVASLRTRASLAVAGAAPPVLARRLERLSWRPGPGLVVQLRDGPRLRFGGGARPAAKWAAAARVLADPSSAGAEYVDLRVPERPAAGGVAPAGQGEPAESPSTPYAGP